MLNGGPVRSVRLPASRLPDAYHNRLANSRPQPNGSTDADTNQSTSVAIAISTIRHADANSHTTISRSFTHTDSHADANDADRLAQRRHHGRHRDSDPAAG